MALILLPEAEEPGSPVFHKRIVQANLNTNLTYTNRALGLQVPSIVRIGSLSREALKKALEDAFNQEHTKALINRSPALRTGVQSLRIKAEEGDLQLYYSL